MSAAKQSKAPQPLTLESIEDALQWARAFMKAQRDRGITYSELTAEQRAIHWIIRELLRMEVLLIARSGDVTLVDRLAETRAMLLEFEGYNQRDDRVMDGVAATIALWAERAPAECDAVLAYASRSAWRVLRWNAAQSLPLDHGPSLALLQQLTRDADDAIKRMAHERLASRQELAMWNVAFSGDPMLRLREHERHAMSAPIAAVCAAFSAPAQWEPEDERKERQASARKLYSAAIEELPNELLFDHARLVLSASGRLDERHGLLLSALGARDGSIALLHLALEREDAQYQLEAIQSGYFARHEARSHEDRAASTLAHLRWLIARAAGTDGWRWVLPARQLQWDKLWPPHTPLQPLYEQLVAGCAKERGNVAQLVLEQVGFATMPAEMRDEILRGWASGAHTHKELGFDPTSLADTLAPSARWAMAQAILRDRRSSEAMQWALHAWGGPLFDEQRDGSRPALAARWCEDPGLRGAILADPALCDHCVEPLRAMLVRGAITRRAELSAVVSAIWGVSDVPEWRAHWWAMKRGGVPRASVQAVAREKALPFCANPASVSALTDDEWNLIRPLRRLALREKGSALSRLDEALFPTSSWTAADLEDYDEFAAQTLAENDDLDLEFLCVMVLTQWTPAMRPRAEQLLAALEESSIDDRASWRERLELALEAE